MWAMHQYLGENMAEENKMVCVCFPFHVCWLIQQNTLLFCVTHAHFDIIPLQQQREELQTQDLLNFEIRGFQDELAVFILEEVLKSNGSFSAFRRPSIRKVLMSICSKTIIIYTLYL
jgi:hypothetical protein